MALLFMPLFASAQNAFQNFGSIKIHSNANVGFHTDLINDGDFDDNLGLVGFYSDNEVRVISGNNRPIFNNVEIDAVNDLELEVALGITNELEYVNGKVITPRDMINVSLDFITHNFYVGEDDLRHTDGYASVLSNKEFIFPIGDDNRLRPMITPKQQQNVNFKGAYYFENPNTPSISLSSFTSTFDTSEKQIFINNISNLEFWDLDGASETVVTLTWDIQSDIESISNDLQSLRVVGWNKQENKWFDLGGNNITGDFNEGKLTSSSFIPDNYDIITIGSQLPNGNIDGTNLLMSPNDDGINDALVFEGLEQYKKNTLSIFNRWGNAVLEVEKYDNNWEGLSEGRATIDGKKQLPVGTYFYILKFGDDSLDKTLTGWIYINR